MRDYKCPNCGASFSLPLGMTCRDHRPEPIPVEKVTSDQTTDLPNGATS